MPLPSRPLIAAQPILTGRPRRRRAAWRWAAALALACARPPDARTREPAAEPPARAEPAPAGRAHRLLWYVPNRVLDFLDIFRVRLRVGPGFAVEARLTSCAAQYAGAYRARYAGLPGPRRAPTWPRLVGRESARGLIVMGVDATDDSDHPPRYSDTELAVGVQVLAAGAALGIDPLELGDFLAGLVLVDLRADDR